MSGQQAARFDGQVALVTGGGSGIGAAVARRLAAEGCVRVHVADIDAANATAVAESVGGRAHVVDVADPQAVDDLVAAVTGADGRLDVVVHTAGVDDPAAKARILAAQESGEPVDVLSDLDDDGWRRVMSINLDGTFHVLRAAVRAMRPRGGGAIVTVGSSAAYDTLVGYPHYAASKAGVHALSQSVAKEVIPYGIRVNTVAPGPVDTPMAGRTPGAVRKAMEASGAIGYASADDLADNICYLASPGAKNVVGAVLLSNGGRFTV
ncbi:NAD dependent epimerase/dehydratase family protein [Nocardioidaceae bacterium Broad-1]|uniref:SDR family NAD(P)-dependent oxidoreductase n=1 Tax=Nocardioides luteus TaxID=1844 RepID=UPI0002028C20|nr:SDR family NAD(P)-dependent oxidoreductase [Nocardioides luteus]EGD44516.1 NAD dependent epimerase/dehydratase family protein [Nocardioidaceae bacterium Broad-1]MBG6096242.1 3-oxoacyl-[acyl-carrier protein] reductase [Nocardioides luteus]